MPPTPQWVWTPQVQTIIVPVSPSTVRIAPIGTTIPKVMFFAEETNLAPICIGPRNMLMPAASIPNVTQIELDPGRDYGIWVDDPIHETFDLGFFFAAHNDSVNTQTLYVTIWTVRKL